jgi:hypothetical protein
MAMQVLPFQVSRANTNVWERKTEEPHSQSIEFGSHGTAEDRENQRMERPCRPLAIYSKRFENKKQFFPFDPR